LGGRHEGRELEAKSDLILGYPSHGYLPHLANGTNEKELNRLILLYKVVAMRPIDIHKKRKCEKKETSDPDSMAP